MTGHSSYWRIFIQSCLCCEKTFRRCLELNPGIYLEGDFRRTPSINLPIFASLFVILNLMVHVFVVYFTKSDPKYLQVVFHPESG